MFDPETLTFSGRGLVLGCPLPLLDGEVLTRAAPVLDGAELVWQLDGGRFVAEIGAGDPLQIICRIEGRSGPHMSIGLRFEAIAGVRSYLRNGYQSWDGSFFAAPGTPAGEGPAAKAPTLGFALTALLPHGDEGALVIGFTRHDRFQSRFCFGGTADAMSLDIETLLDRVPGAQVGEPLALFGSVGVEQGLRQWSQLVAAHSPLPPRVPPQRITGWCSWYNHYALIDPAALRAELAGAAAFRDAHQVPLDVFLIDDGFTPEMGDWLDFKPQFPDGVAPLVAEITAAGFTPGLWIAPFMVGNRSKLYAAHPDWVVQDVAGEPLVQYRFYGEFRWHKRSEEYYILDVTHPDAAAYIAEVLRTWRSWGAGYFKTDFMLFGSEHGPDTAVWHQGGQSRIAIWRQMAALIREAIGDALWLGCGCPLWASVGYFDAVRIGRDIGVTWHGEYSAESLLRDLATRNHANGVLWQADPDCLLLRDRFHELSAVQVDSLARYGAACGGVLMTSDTLSELSPGRASLFAQLLNAPVTPCHFPTLGNESGAVIEYRSGGSNFVFNLSGEPFREGPLTIGPYATGFRP
jgi:alpha-galactosidase